MRSFRFPRLAILLMVATLLTILAAIGLAAEMARAVQHGYGGPNLSDMWWAVLPKLFAALLTVLWGVGAVAYAIVFGLGKAGVHRLGNVVTWPERRP